MAESARRSRPSIPRVPRDCGAERGSVLPLYDTIQPPSLLRIESSLRREVADLSHDGAIFIFKCRPGDDLTCPVPLCGAALVPCAGEARGRLLPTEQRSAVKSVTAGQPAPRLPAARYRAISRHHCKEFAPCTVRAGGPGREDHCNATARGRCGRACPERRHSARTRIDRSASPVDNLNGRKGGGGGGGSLLPAARGGGRNSTWAEPTRPSA